MSDLEEICLRQHPNYLGYWNKVSITEILEEVMAFDLGNIDRHSQMRVAHIAV